MIEEYLEYGAIGVIITLFIGMIKFLQSSLTSKLSEVEEICIKLIDRWNRSDEIRDRRHEQLLEQVNRITDDLNYIKGKNALILGTGGSAKAVISWLKSLNLSHITIVSLKSNSLEKFLNHVKQDNSESTTYIGLIEEDPVIKEYIKKGSAKYIELQEANEFRKIIKEFDNFFKIRSLWDYEDY